MHANGFPYTQEEVEEAAKKKGLSIEDFLNETPELSITGKAKDSTEDPTGSQSTTGSGLESGGSEQSETNLYDTGWGDKIYHSGFGKFVRGSFRGIGGQAEVKAEAAEFKAKESKRRDNDVWRLQATDFENELDKAFEDPNLFQKILGDEKTLQNRDVEGGGGLNSAEYLQDIVQKKFGGMGWGDNRKVDPTTGQPVYSQLTNSDMNALITEKFNAKLYEEQTNVSNGRGTAANFARQKAGISLEDYWNEDSNTTISSFTGNDKKLAELYKEIKSGNLREVDRLKKVKKFHELRKIEGKQHMVMDVNTGMLRVASDDKHRDKLLEEGHIPLNISEKQKEYENITDYDILKQEYQRSALALGGLNSELDEVVKWEGEEYNMELRGLMPASGSSTIRDIIRFSTDGRKPTKYTDKEWDQIKARLKDDTVDYNADHEALKRMYFLNEGIKDQDIGVSGKPHSL